MPESTGTVYSRQNGNLVNNNKYQVIITRKTSGRYPDVVIKANLPESFSFGVTSSYQQRLPSDLASVLPGFEKLGTFFHASRIFQEFSHQVWENSSPIQFSLPLLFDAVTDAEEDVITPIRDLMAMALPYRENDADAFLKPPGPTLRNPDYGRVSMLIGRMCYFHSVLINDVNPAFDTRMSKTGSPISATCDLSVTTINTPSRDDLDLFFLAPNARRNISQADREQYGTAYRFDSIQEAVEAAISGGIEIFEGGTSFVQQVEEATEEGIEFGKEALSDITNPNTALSQTGPPEELSNLN